MLSFITSALCFCFKRSNILFGSMASHGSLAKSTHACYAEWDNKHLWFVSPKTTLTWTPPSLLMVQEENPNECKLVEYFSAESGQILNDLDREIQNNSFRKPNS